MKQIFLTFSASVFFLFFISCEAVENNDISFGYDIQPIFRTNCSDCHFSEKNSSANLNLSSYETLMHDTSDSGPVVIPKHPEHSLLVDRISNSTFGPRMPFNLPPLTNEEIGMIEMWIYRGAKDN